MAAPYADQVPTIGGNVPSESPLSEPYADQPPTSTGGVPSSNPIFEQAPLETPIGSPKAAPSPSRVNDANAPLSRSLFTAAVAVVLPVVAILVSFV
jgi:hypothetical protein